MDPSAATPATPRCSPRPWSASPTPRCERDSSAAAATTAGPRSRSPGPPARGATSMGTSRWTVCVALLGLLPAGLVRAQTPQEKKRGDILKDLGLKKKPSAPPPEAAPLPPEPPAEDGAKASAPGGAIGKPKGAGKGAAPAAPAAPSFSRAVHPL